MLNNINAVLQGDQLVKLVQKPNFIGWVYDIDYDTARIMTNDLWKAQARGVPLNCFLVATAFDPDNFASTQEADREVILLRVVRASHLPQDNDLIAAKVDHFQQQKGAFASTGLRDFDDITLSQMQFSGLECRVLGTFYARNGQLWLGSDLESFAVATRLRVFRPQREALSLIVNYVDPLRREQAAQAARDLGFDRPIGAFPLGTVRYTSTEHIHRAAAEDLVEVTIQPFDFLARRTAVLGMTRTGKSNMVKHAVSVVKRIADESRVPIGQIIYDLNGEYANANRQDQGAIADVYPQQTIRYRMLQTPGFRELQNNFYLQLSEGLGTLRRILQDRLGNITQPDLSTFLSMSLDEPSDRNSGEYRRWAVKAAAYCVVLRKSGFEVPANFRVTFQANETVRRRVQAAASNAASPVTLKDPRSGLTLDEAEEWFTFAREANDPQNPLPSSTPGKPWLDSEGVALLNMMAKKNSNGAYINGYSVLADLTAYHSARRAQEVGAEIYAALAAGNIVILDLSVGDPTLREMISTQIARTIFNRSMMTFIADQQPPNIVVYIEEAHNLIGKGSNLTETWPRLAKEGAKYRIALVYATQEVSSVHPNILANTENWFISHLNNTNEIKELAKFYDFEDFSRSLMRAQDVGFARVKTLSSPFIIPVQIAKFDPEQARQQLTRSAAAVRQNGR